MTPAEFKTNYPQFASTADADIQRQIDLFATLYQGDYGDAADYLLGLFVAHQISVMADGGSAPGEGIKTSKSVGDVSVGTGSYLTFQGRTAHHLNSTKFGQEFQDIMRLFGMGPVMAGKHFG